MRRCKIQGCENRITRANKSRLCGEHRSYAEKKKATKRRSGNTKHSSPEHKQRVSSWMRRYHRNRIQKKLDRLDERSLALFEKCFTAGMATGEAFAVAADDMELRARTAAERDRCERPAAEMADRATFMPPPEGYETWDDYIQNPPPPTEALRELFRKYRANQAKGEKSEIDRLRHDLERQMRISLEQTNEIERLRAERDDAREALSQALNRISTLAAKEGSKDAA